MKFPTFNKKTKRLLLLGAIGIGALILAYPFLPLITYSQGQEAKGSFTLGPTTAAALSAATAGQGNEVATQAPVGNIATAQDRIEQKSYLLIPKIGVRINIVAGTNESYALSKGAWSMPQTSTPDKGGNTVLAAHRYRYMPPHEETFYLLHKLVPGDVFYVVWKGQEYHYRVRSSETVAPDAMYVLNPTSESVVKLLTCEPIFSSAQRLVVTGELVQVI
ncbi:MAG: sortase [Candidatus Spechtbacterales bacterium]